MHATSLLPTSIAALLLGACAGPAREPLSPLGAHSDVELDYAAHVAPGAWEPVDETFLREPQIDLETVDAFIEVHASFVAIEADQVDELFGRAQHGPWAVTTSRASAARFLRELDEDVVHEQRLTVAEGQPGHVLLANQVAYIQRFEIEHSNAMSVADPVVAVASDGHMLDFAARLDGEAVQLEIELVQSRLQRPLTQVDVQLPGLFMPVTIQQPITSKQTMKVATRLDADEILMLGIPEVGAGRFLVGYVSARTIRRVDVAPGTFIEDVDAAARDSATSEEAEAEGTAVEDSAVEDSAAEDSAAGSDRKDAR